MKTITIWEESDIFPGKTVSIGDDSFIIIHDCKEMYGFLNKKSYRFYTLYTKIQAVNFLNEYKAEPVDRQLFSY